MTDMERYHQPTDSWVPVLGAVGDLAQRIAATEFVPRALRGKPAGTAAAILTGRELGLGPMASLRGIQVIEGQVSLTAQMTAARILAAGHRIEWAESTDRAAHVRIIRGDGLGEAEARFTITDAQRAGIAGKSNWQKWPRAMLRARALSECAGMCCADVILGLESTADTTSEPLEIPQQTKIVQLPAKEPEPEPEPIQIIDYGEAPEPEQDEPSGSEPQSQRTGPVPGRSAGGTNEADLPDPEPEPITGPQMRRLQAMLNDLDQVEGRRLDRDERRDLIRGLAGLDELTSAKNLTKQQATQAIDALQSLIETARRGSEEPPDDATA